MSKLKLLILIAARVLASAGTVFADIKVRQRVKMSGQTYETVTMIKGARTHRA